MTQIASTYNNNEMGWVSEIFSIEKPTGVIVTLKKRGRIVVKKSNEKGGEQAKVLVTPITGPVFELMVSGEVEGKYLQIVTSEEPEKIEIFGDVTPAEEWYLRVSTDYIFIDRGETSKYFSVTSNTTWIINL